MDKFRILDEIGIVGKLQKRSLIFVRKSYSNNRNW
jgi:hypothetical protein